MRDKQLAVDHARRAVLELAHALVDQRDDVHQPVGHRRVDGVAHRLRIDPLQADAIRGLVLGIDRLGVRDHVGQDLELFRHAGAAGEDHVDEFLVVEQPERQFQVARVEHQRALAEAAAVFVVHVEQEQAQVRPDGQDLVQQQRHAARLADAGGAQHGKMLVEHLVDVDVGADARILLQVADVDRVLVRRRVHRAQLLAGDRVHLVVDRRIDRHAALEARARRAGVDLAEQVDRGGRDIAVAIGGRQAFAAHLGDHGDHVRVAAADRDEAADRRAGLGLVHLRRGMDAKPRERSLDRDDPAEREWQWKVD